MERIAWLAGTVQFALSFQQLRKANPREKIPAFFGRPRNHPGEIYVYRSIAVILLLLSFFVWVEVVGAWAVVTLLAGATSAAILHKYHNRRVQGSPTYPKPVRGLGSCPVEDPN